jgi:hypothetical protein
MSFDRVETPHLNNDIEPKSSMNKAETMDARLNQKQKDAIDL